MSLNYKGLDEGDWSEQLENLQNLPIFNKENVDVLNNNRLVANVRITKKIFEVILKKKLISYLHVKNITSSV